MRVHRDDQPSTVRSPRPAGEGRAPARARPEPAAASRRPAAGSPRSPRPFRRAGPQQLIGCVRVRADQVAGRVGGERDARESRPEPVVQVATEPAAFLLDCGHRLAARLHQVHGQGAGPQGLREQRCGQPEHVLVSREKVRSPGRSPTTSSPAVPPRANERVRGGGPGPTSRPVPSTRRPAYGSTSASRIARSASTGSSPIRPATWPAAPSGSGREPKSSSSTTPRSMTCNGWKVIATSAPTRPSAPGLSGRSPPPPGTRQRDEQGEVPDHGDREDHRCTTSPRTSTISGSATPTYIAGPPRRTEDERAEAPVSRREGDEPCDEEPPRPQGSSTAAAGRPGRRARPSTRCGDQREPDRQSHRVAHGDVLPLGQPRTPEPATVASATKSTGCRHPSTGYVVTARGSRSPPQAMIAVHASPLYRAVENRTGHPGGAGQRQQGAGSPRPAYDEQRRAADDGRQPESARATSIGSGGLPATPSPPSRARMIAPARSATSSSAKMLVRWLLTVFGERNSRSAMTEVRRPAASRSRISRSRSVSSGNGSAAGGRVGRRSSRARGRPPRAEDRLAGDDRADRADDLVLLGALEQVAPSAGLHRGEHGRVVVEHREHQYGGLRHAGPDPPGRLDPVEPGHPHVHEHHVGPEQLHLAHGRLAVAASPTTSSPSRSSRAARAARRRTTGWSSASTIRNGVMSS